VQVGALLEHRDHLLLPHDALAHGSDDRSSGWEASEVRAGDEARHLGQQRCVQADYLSRRKDLLQRVQGDSQVRARPFEKPSSTVVRQGSQVPAPLWQAL
jgi:hypothetical protein